ncbi:MAG TPA: hemerythrin domain-containing protein [Bacteroidales bacterium]|jgi:regulator of cell morphogenesis and NO signaling|nr:hemerythrin domain-containing protein [Bacteroidales bacterium]HOS57139.1 hemerythrin domain-containing protein [Bacteroidales bacterium]HXK74715.1 hemerythrin domain-containing protein [Bacteroidales bacterium]
MKKTIKQSISPDTILSDLILDNPQLLLMMEHFGLNIVVHKDTIRQICEQNQISIQLFILILQLYLYGEVFEKQQLTKNDLLPLVNFLKNSHFYFRNEKFPEIEQHINKIVLNNNTPPIKLLKQFYKEYLVEVEKHLTYEEKYVFPYIQRWIDNNKESNDSFSINQYKKRHTDIEYKILEMKNLLIKHIELEKDMVGRRKLLVSLSEVEHDLYLHSYVEDNILIPLIINLENR